MELLNGPDSERLYDLYRQNGKQFPIIASVVRGQQRCSCLADSPSKPQAAMVFHDTGFAMFLGKSDSFEEQLIGELCQKKLPIPSYILWYDAPERIINKIQEKIHGPVRKRERMRFQYRPDTNAAHGTTQQKEIRAESISKANFEEVEKLGLKIGSRFWRSQDDFLQNGLGSCCFYENEIASACYSVAVADNQAEIDVFCREEFRRKNLAVVAVQHFLDGCKERNITPMWDAFVNNEASMKLAGKCGFVEGYRYNFYSFNIPL